MGKVGGHCNMTNMDEGALLFLARAFSVKSIVDVGCGPGGMVEFAISNGIKAFGIDGDESVKPDVCHDFDSGPLAINRVDLAWSVEFLEHLEKQYLSNVFSVFEKCKYVFCTHNDKPGPYHFNCQPNWYWLAVFKSRGFNYDEKTTELIKQHSTMEREFVQNTGQFFVNEGWA